MEDVRYRSQPRALGSAENGLYLPTDRNRQHVQQKELQDLYQACKDCGLYLFVDGARLGYVLGAPDNDMTAADLAANCDVFYIGGTKCGLFFGEAVVILNNALKPDFRTIAKQCGSIMAKGRLLGVQFGAIMKDNFTAKSAVRAHCRR